MTTKKFQLNLGDRDLIVEAINLAEQANGSLLIRYGDTTVLATAVMSKEEKENLDFFPLTVDYEERYYAAGKIFGSRYMKREGRPSDEAIVNARLIDRAIRPLFPKGLKREIQVIITCLSWDNENDPDIIGLLAASLALSISNIPWLGPVAPLRVGRKDGTLTLNPIYNDREKSDFDLLISAVSDSDGHGEGNWLLNMIEAGANEAGEDAFLEAVRFGGPFIKKIIEFQNQIAKEIGAEKIAIPQPLPDLALESEMKDLVGDRLEKTMFQKAKTERAAALSDLKTGVIDFIEKKYPGMGKGKYAQEFFENEIDRIIHQKIIERELRPDGRKLDELREINCEVGVLPRTHGSAIFSRGETKSLSILTLGAPGDQRLIEGMEIRGKKRFMLHYNFPPYCSGEVKPVRGPGRREIGHGMLAEKTLMPLIPTFEEFPYTIRVVSEILSSNGSTSMASACSSSLALMDAGVPIKAAAAGIAIGLMSDKKGNYKILTDIQGPEDHYGDMDFKIAGTAKGITAIQMDVKVKGITEKILGDAFAQAKKARLQILEKMNNVLAQSRPSLSPYAPRILVVKINPEKIREVVGPGGKIINEIIEKCEVAIDIQPTGTIFVTADKEDAAKKAVSWIKNITREVKAGEIFQGKVKRILNFGAFVEILPGQEGLVHISQLAPHRVEKVEDIVRVGDIIPVKVIGVDEQGRIDLSLKATQETEENTRHYPERRKRDHDETI